MTKDLSFSQRFGSEPSVIVRSPGRANLIGEHTDYNQGYVLPFAVDRYTKLAASPRSDRKLNVYSEKMEQGVEIDLDGHLDLIGESMDWRNYVRGTAWWLRNHNYAPAGADVLVWGDLPVSAGLSSSASLLMGMLGALTAVSGVGIPRAEMARAAQAIESEFIGMPVGLMDQTVIGMAEVRSALLIDCRSMETTPVPMHLDSKGLSLVLVNSGIARDPENTAYARRRRECEEALGAFRVITYNLQLASLRDVDTEMLSKYASKLYPTLYKRARHVVTENERVLEAVNALGSGDLERVGRLMNESHNSLANDFEVSNPFIDRLVELARENDTVLGAKLTGAGFGGCTVNLVRSDGIRAFTREVV
ncbi:MAG TPA: galactokinase, partial [Chloroflexia bacterium]|nr:galactokinase [Chloroflexia bacterium]